jgi:hypothetical protein
MTNTPKTSEPPKPINSNESTQADGKNMLQKPERKVNAPNVIDVKIKES